MRVIIIILFLKPPGSTTINMIKIKNCILCGNSKFKPLYSAYDRMFNLPGEFFVKKCDKCSLVFLDPQPSKETLKKYYPSFNYYSYVKNKKKGFFEMLRTYLIKHYYSPTLLSLLISNLIQKVPAIPDTFVKSGRIIDIGCGAGDTLLLLKDLGWNTFGIEIDKNAIENAKKRGLSNIKLGTYRDLARYPDNYFDAVRLYHVIEHLDDPFLCLSLIKKKLKKNGELIIGTPNIKSLVGTIFKSHWYNLDSPRHLFIFSPVTLKKLVDKEGFINKKIEFGSAGGIAGSIQYLINDIFGKRIDLIHWLPIAIIFYPLEWLLDKFSLGDVFTIRASKK